MSLEASKVVHFASTVSGATTVAVPVRQEGRAGKFAVYVRKTSGSGSATLTVKGGFTSTTSDTTGVIQITAATAISTGALTLVTTPTDRAFPILHLIWTATNDVVGDVYIISY